MKQLSEDLIITECPRDAMQGIETFIPTPLKIEYLNLLLQVGFHTIDFGSFVSPKAIPQLKDTAKVLNGLALDTTKSKLLSIVANLRGAQEACVFQQIYYLGFPLSLSEAFQQRNTNKSIAEAYPLISEIQNLCMQHGKALVVYLSMGFGNPYGDPYEFDYILNAIGKLREMGIQHILPSDTIGVGTPESIKKLFEFIIPNFPDIAFGAHLHTHPNNGIEKLEAAYEAGCRRFDTSIKGIGGCPMATDELVGNIATERLLSFASKHRLTHALDMEKFSAAFQKADHLFSQYH